MRMLAVGNRLAPTLFTSCNALPPEGAVFSLGRPGGKIAPTLYTSSGSLPHQALAARQSLIHGPCWLEESSRSLIASRSLLSDFLPLPPGEGWGEGSPRSAPAPQHRFTGLHHAGFTLLELLVVIAIIAVAPAGVSLSLRDSSQTALEREAQRLAVLFESARAQSRASGTAVIWRPTVEGFRFEGLQPGALPTRWLEAGTRAGANVAIQLGPEPIIGAQTVEIVSGGQDQAQPARVLRIATDGLRPFALQTAEQP